jgi:peroxiredoxin
MTALPSATNRSFFVSNVPGRPVVLVFYPAERSPV